VNHRHASKSAEENKLSKEIPLEGFTIRCIFLKLYFEIFSRWMRKL